MRACEKRCVPLVRAGRRRLRVSVFLLGCGVALTSHGWAHAEGGSIKGRVLDAAQGGGVKRVTARAFGAGRSAGVGAQTEGDGSYIFRDLPGGRYGVCLSAGQRYRPVSVPEVNVYDGQTTVLDLKVGQSLMIEGDSWVQAYPSFCQSFTASGLGVTMLGVKGFGPARRVRVAVRAGDGPRGQPIGPARETKPVGGEATEVVRWSGGEVRTVAGHRYTVEMTALDGATWVPGVAGRGDVYASGSAYFDGVARPHSDLGIILCEDKDGLRTNYACGEGWRRQRARSAGQTFKALSGNITFASAVLSGLAGPPVYVRFSVHAGGPGGRQIGPSKSVQAGRNAAVAWAADEAPVAPGETYYLHMECIGGQRFLGAVQPDSYVGGTAFFDGRAAQEKDLCAMVIGRITDDDFARLVAHPRHQEVVPLVNASFEEGDAGWQRYGVDVAGEVVGCDNRLAPMWGLRMFGWTKEKQGEGSRPTIYQQVNVTKGESYCFSGSVYTDHVGGRSSDVKVRLVAAPGGGADMRNYEVIESSQWYATEGEWRRGSVEFRATADIVTVGFEMEQRFNLERSSLYVDGAHLERIGAE